MWKYMSLSLSSGNKHICKHFHKLHSSSAYLQFLSFALQNWLMTCSLFVTSGQYSNDYIFYDCVNWFASGCGQVSTFWEAVAKLEPRHLFLILWSCVAYWILFLSPCSFFSSFPLLEGKVCLWKLGGSIFLVLLGLHRRIHVCLIDVTGET